MSLDAGDNEACFSLVSLEKTTKNDTNTKQYVAEAFHDCSGKMERVCGGCCISLERSTQLKRK